MGIAAERNGVVVTEMLQGRHVDAPAASGEELHRKEKLSLPEPDERSFILCQSSAGDQHVDAVVRQHVSSAGVQDHDDARDHAVFFAAQIKHGTGNRPEEQVGQSLLVLADEACQNVRQSKDHTIVGDAVDMLGFALCPPLKLAGQSAGRAVPVPAGVAADLSSLAFRADRDGISKLPGPAGYDGVYHFLLMEGYRVLFDIIREEFPEDLPDCVTMILCPRSARG